MCEGRTLRYVHHMEHTDYPETLGVGSVCAGHMEEDLAGARAREDAMASRSGKRRRWLSRRWRISGKGNEWLQADGYRVTIYQRAGSWAAAVSSLTDDFVKHSRRRYSSSDEAKLAAFDVITQRLALRSSLGAA